MIRSQAAGLTARGMIPFKQRPEYLPGQLVVRINQRAVRPHLPQGVLAFRATSASRVPDEITAPIEYLRRNAGLKDLRPLFSRRKSAFVRSKTTGTARSALAMMTSVADSESEDLAGLTIMHVDAKKLTPALMKRLSASRAVQFAERVPARWLAATAVDPMQNLQWGLRAIKWFDAKIPNAEDVTVAVLDTGIDQPHPDLKDIPVQYHHKNLKAQDLVGHGTHVAGIIAAGTNNSVGISGIAKCGLSIWKIFSDQPYMGDFYVDTELFLEALNGVVADGARVVNLSIGGSVKSQSEQLLMKWLAARGVLVIAAMGNEFLEGNPTSYPAAYKDVLAVGAIDETLRRARFSNTGRHIGLMAPGTNILSTLPMKKSQVRDETEYAAWSGTSMATPHVAAAAALLIAKRPSITVEQLRSRLIKSTTLVPNMRNKKWTPSYGSGLLNVHKLLQ